MNDQPSALLIKFPGTNCDAETARALQTAGFVSTTVPISLVTRDHFKAAQLVVMSGGFSYGDYVMAGRIAQLVTERKLGNAIESFIGSGGYVLGICNGFQVITEMGLLPGVLMRNATLKFVCRTVALKVATTQSDFTSAYRPGQEIRIPIAHHDGNYTIDAEGLVRLKDQDRIAFTYAQNPNGSMADIAGVLSENRRVLGMMPHPERATEAALGGSDGKGLFAALMRGMALA